MRKRLYMVYLTPKGAHPEEDVMATVYAPSATAAKRRARRSFVRYRKGDRLTASPWRGVFYA